MQKYFKLPVSDVFNLNVLHFNFAHSTCMHNLYYNIVQSLIGNVDLLKINRIIEEKIANNVRYDIPFRNLHPFCTLTVT